jgi:hypothetical protein
VVEFKYLEMTLRNQNFRSEGVSCIKNRTQAKVPEEVTCAYDGGSNRWLKKTA